MAIQPSEGTHRRAEDAAPFDVEAYLASAGPARKVVKYRRGEVVFSQGDAGHDIRYLQKGAIKLSVLSRIGKEAVVAMLVARRLFRRGRAGRSTASHRDRDGDRAEQRADHREGGDGPAAPRTARVRGPFHLLHADRGTSASKRISSISCSTPAKSGSPGRCCCWRATARPIRTRTLPKISQETLAEMIGATRSRVNFFMNKFRKLGFIEYNGGLKINSSLLSIVLHD